jgi:hypothetical protein
MKRGFQPAYIFPLVLLGLLVGIAGGWLRLGYAAFLIPHAAAQHGLMMVGGFLGTLIALERALVMKHKGWFAVPLVGGLSIPLQLLGFSDWALVSIGAASLGLLAIMYLQSLRHPVLDQYLLLVGAACWVLGNFIVYHTGFVPAGAPWWIGFILFTIVGERLELSKFLPVPNWTKQLLLLTLVGFFLGMWIPFHSGGIWLLGVSMILISAWLLKFDMARYAAKKTGIFRYIGVGLVTGYVWLLIHGLILFSIPDHPLHYDMYLHTFFLGFTFSMIWAHAPIILPAVLKIRHQPYHPLLWVGWSVFQLSLLGRVWSSWAGYLDGRLWCSVINGWTILVMFAAMGGVVLMRKKEQIANEFNGKTINLPLKKKIDEKKAAS